MKSFFYLISILALVYQTGFRNFALADGDRFIRINPAPFGDIDRGKKIVNQTPDPDEEESSDKEVTLNLRDFQNGFRVTKYYNIEIGFGGAGNWQEGGSSYFSSLMPTFGIIPMVGKTAISVRFVQDYDKTKESAALKFPSRAADLLDWYERDNLTVQMVGGLQFIGGMSMGLTAVGTYAARGEWTTYVEKVGATVVAAKITKSKVNAFGFATGPTLLILAVQEFGTVDRSFSYSFDLSVDGAAKAYEDFINGNLIPAQELAKIQDSGVYPTETANTINRGSLKQAWFGVPVLLNVRFRDTQVQNISDLIDHTNGAKTHREVGVYNWERFSRAFFRHTFRTVMFLGLDFKTIFENGFEMKSRFGQIILGYEDDSTTLRDLKGMLEELWEQTGMRRALGVKVPEDVKHFGYMSLQFMAGIPEETTNYLAALGSSSASREKLIQDGIQLSEARIWKMCERYADQYGPDSCADRELRALRRQLTFMADQLKAMDQNRDNGGTFARAYGEFGRWLLSSEYTFQAFLNACKDQSLDMDFIIEGEIVSRVRKKISVLDAIKWDSNSRLH